MPSALVARFRNDVAPRLMSRFDNDGVDVVIRVITPNPDPLLPPAESATSNHVNAVAFGVSGTILTSDANLVATDLIIRVAAIDYIPVVGAWVDINGDTRAIVRVDAIPAAGDAAFYRFFVR